MRRIGFLHWAVALLLALSLHAAPLLSDWGWEQEQGLGSYGAGVGGGPALIALTQNLGAPSDASLGAELEAPEAPEAATPDPKPEEAPETRPQEALEAPEVEESEPEPEPEPVVEEAVPEPEPQEEAVAQAEVEAPVEPEPELPPEAEPVPDPLADLLPDLRSLPVAEEAAITLPILEAPLPEKVLEPDPQPEPEPELEPLATPEPEPKPEVVEAPPEPAPRPPQKPRIEVAEAKPEPEPKPEPPAARPEPPAARPEPEEAVEDASALAKSSAALDLKEGPAQSARTSQQAALGVQGDSDQGAGLGPTPGASGSTSEYEALVSAWLEKFKKYPRRAQLRRQQGEATLTFVVRADGQVLESRVTSSSGYRMLDNAALQMLQDAEPLPPFPPDLALSEVKMIVPARFFLE